MASDRLSAPNAAMMRDAMGFAVRYPVRSDPRHVPVIIVQENHRNNHRHMRYVSGVTAARALSPKLHISYLDLCCLDARTLPLSSLGITLCI